MMKTDDGGFDKLTMTQQKYRSRFNRIKFNIVTIRYTIISIFLVARSTGNPSVCARICVYVRAFFFHVRRVGGSNGGVVVVL